MDIHPLVWSVIGFLLLTVPWTFVHPSIKRWWTERSAERTAAWGTAVAHLAADRHLQFLVVAEEGRLRAYATLWMVLACFLYAAAFLVQWHYPTHGWISGVFGVFGFLLYGRSFLKMRRANDIEMLLKEANRSEVRP